MDLEVNALTALKSISKTKEPQWNGCVSMDPMQNALTVLINSLSQILLTFHLINILLTENLNAKESILQKLNAETA